MSKPNDPAFPIQIPPGHYRMGESGDGLSKREYFAAMAMQGLLSNSISGSHRIPKRLSTEAVQYADALLAELERTKECESS